jgi:GTP cyclohydrolase I
MDPKKMEEGIRRFLEGIGERFEGDDLEKTPLRVAKAWAEDLISGYGLEPVDEVTWTPTPPGAGLVALRGVAFASVCVHHLLPFTGTAHLAYLPDRRLAGLSKLGRVVDALSRRLQIQERLTAQIADVLQDALEPRGVAVVLEAEHTCMTLRGVRKEGSRLVTVAARGLFEHDAPARREALAALGHGSGPAG